MGQRSAGEVEFATAERSAGRWRIMQHSAAQGDAGDTAGQRRMVQETQRSTVQGGKSHITEAAQGGAIHHPRTQRRAMPDDTSTG